MSFPKPFADRFDLAGRVSGHLNIELRFFRAFLNASLSPSLENSIGAPYPFLPLSRFMLVTGWASGHVGSRYARAALLVKVPRTLGAYSSVISPFIDFPFVPISLYCGKFKNRTSQKSRTCRAPLPFSFTRSSWPKCRSSAAGPYSPSSSSLICSLLPQGLSHPTQFLAVLVIRFWTLHVYFVRRFTFR